MEDKQKIIEESVRNIQKILIEDDRIPISSGKEINKNLNIILENIKRK